MDRQPMSTSPPRCPARQTPAGLRLVAASVITALLAAGAASAQDFSGAFVGMQDTDQPIQIEANRLEVTDSKGTAVFDGNVIVVQGSTILKTSRLVVVYARGGEGSNGNIRTLEASGKLAVRSGDQQVSADSGRFDMQSEQIRLSGDVVISQGPNVVTGCSLDVDLKTGAATLQPCTQSSTGGRIKMLITPNSVPNQ